jgi:hypothetical protein
VLATWLATGGGPFRPCGSQCGGLGGDARAMHVSAQAIRPCILKAPLWLNVALLQRLGNAGLLSEPRFGWPTPDLSTAAPGPSTGCTPRSSLAKRRNQETAWSPRVGTVLPAAVRASVVVVDEVYEPAAVCPRAERRDEQRRAETA